MKIAILGAGAYGSALGGVATDNGHEVEYYDPIKGFNNLNATLKDADYTILSVPAAFCAELLDKLPKDKPLIVATKGFLTTTLFDDFQDYMVVSGPGFADDIKAKRPTYLTITDERIRSILRADYMDFDFAADKTGVLMCGALKNVYALLAGYRKLERDSELWRRYITEATEEMQALLSCNNANPETVSKYCGIGDLELTCGLPSRNYEYGARLSDDSSAIPDKTVEGLTTLGLIQENLISIPENTPILQEILQTFNRKEEDA